MNMRELIRTELPLNRKERFFTGTVFPMLVCKDNFKHFNLFTSLIEGYDDVHEVSSFSDIQFFTEYSLAESIVSKADRDRFRDPPRAKDTPDVIILLTKQPKTMLSIEAKMYDVPDAYQLKTQMDSQRKHIEYLRDTLQIERIRQLALLPLGLCEQVSYQKNNTRYVSRSEYQIVTWEELYQKYKDVCRDDYFLHLLKLALDLYPELQSHPWISSNCELKICGREIYEKYKQGALAVKTMGRDKGLDGECLRRDIESGRWKTQQYETSSQECLPTDNWFLIQEFVKRVDQGLAGSDVP